MASTVVEALLAASQRAVAAFKEELDASEKGVEAARAIRAGFLQPDAIVDMVEATEMASEAASTANATLKRAHADLMRVHYMSLRGDNIVDTSQVVEAAADKAAETYARQWSVPQDDVVDHLLALTSPMEQESGSSNARATGDMPLPTPAAAAFAAAQEAAKRRLEQRLANKQEEASVVVDDTADNGDNLDTLACEANSLYDFSMFNKELWARVKSKADEMSMQQQPGVFCFRESMPHPEKKVLPCAQVKVRHVVSNTEMKIANHYAAMAAGGSIDKVGFILNGDVGRFITLAKDKSDEDASTGGDLGWVTRGKLDPKIEEVIFHCPRLGCSPPFRVKLASFQIIFIEDRR